MKGAIVNKTKSTFSSNPLTAMAAFEKVKPLKTKN